MPAETVLPSTGVVGTDADALRARVIALEALLAEHQQNTTYHRAIVESSDDAIISKDLNGIITSWNKGAERIFGHRAEEIVGRSVLTLIPEELHAEEPMILARLRRGERIDHFTTTRVARDGKRLDISLTVSPLKNDQGTIIGASKVARDITREKRAMDSLRESEEKFASLFNGAPVGAVLVEMPSSRIMEANPAFMELCGLGAEELRGLPLLELAEGDDREDHRRSLAELQQHGVLRDVELRLRRKVGSTFDVLINATTIQLHGNSQLLLYVEDITARKQAESALKEADQRKDEFLATLAHELRGPLAPLSNSLQLMALAEDDAVTVRQARELMDRQLHHMVRLVNDLMDVSRVSRGIIELRKAPVDLRNVLVQSLEAARPLINAQRHHLTQQIPATPCLVQGDATRLVQVFSNLLNNAAKYTEPGGTLHLEADAQGDRIVVSISDSGIGIPPDKLERVFGMFAQLENGSSRKQGGLGIGLSIAKSLVEMHQGTISAYSEGAHKGSRFTVELPLHQEAVPGASPQAVTEHPGSAVRVLVVDDNMDAAVTMAMVMRQRGHTVRVVHSGEDAVELAPIFEPDLIILDIGMPGMNGYETCRAIRGMPQGHRPYIVALTGWGQEEDRRRSKTAGFDLHHLKPISREDLFAVIGTVVERSV